MPNHDELLAHANFVRAMARSLVADIDQAEEIEQTTWLAVLKRPPKREVPMRSWLASVVRNLARQSRRSEARRRTHESTSPAPGLAVDAATTVANEEAIRVMTDAVLDLREPYRSTILQRYYEELSVHEIAVRGQIPVATAKTRLRRGLQHLREHLDASHSGDRRRWIAGLAPLAGARLAASAGSAALSPVVGGITALKVGIVAIALVAVCIPIVSALDLWSGTPPLPPVHCEAVVVPPPSEPEMQEDLRSEPGQVTRDATDLAQVAGPAPEPAPEAPKPAASQLPQRPVDVPVAAEPTAVLRFTINGAPVATSVRLRVYAAADPRDNWQDTSVVSFFDGLRAQCGHVLTAAVDRVVSGRITGTTSVAFEAGSLPAGPVLVWVETESRGGYAAYHQFDATAVNDLGEVKVLGRSVRVVVKDRESGQPVQGAEVRCVQQYHTLGDARRTDAQGTLVWPQFLGTAVQVSMSGYAPRVARLRGDSATVDLVVAANRQIRAPAGTWVFVQTRSARLYAVADARGIAVLPCPKGESEGMAFFFDPKSGRWHAGPLPDGEPPVGLGSLTMKVASGGRPLAAGSIELTSTDPKLRLRRMVGIKDGIAVMHDLPVGGYRPVIRCGPQIHDNDHEFYLPEIGKKAGDQAESLVLPGGTLQVQIIEKSGVPCRFNAVYYYVRGEDKARGIRYKIKPKGRTDGDGRVTFSALPADPGELRIGWRGEKVAISPGEGLQIVQLRNQVSK